MLSRNNRKLRYLNNLIANAYWLLREGKFRLFLAMLKREASFQIEILHNRLNTHTDRRRLRQPSYRPTILKRVDEAPMQANAEAVQQELSKILSSLNMSERS